MSDNRPPADSHAPTTDDTLGFKPTVDAVAKKIQENKNNKRGFTVGIFGDWGTGKSSFLLQLREKLDGDTPEGYTFVCFQAWRFRRADNPEIALVNTMFSEQDTLLKETWDYINGKVRAFLRGIKFEMKASTVAPAGANVEGVVKADLGKMATAQELIRDQQEKKRHGTMIEERFFLHEAVRETFEGLKDKPCVVFVDDLDRCMNEEALYILEAMKAIFDVPNCVFVIAADRRKIKEAIRTRYSEIEADTYFRKFINLSVSIPRLKMDARFLKPFLDKRLAHLWRRDNRATPE